MKKKLKLGICAFLALGILTSCNTQTSNNSTSFDNSTSSSIDYTIYTSAYGFKGTEVYCWKIDNDSWRCGALIGTNIAKKFEQLNEIQEIYPCPLDTMKCILSTYPDEVRKSILILILPYPVTKDNYFGKLPDEETLAFLKGELGLL